MLLLPFSRYDLLQFLPKNAEVAEIGVAQGVFSDMILEKAQPKRLHLIDPWEHQSAEDYQADPNNVTDSEHQSRYDGICHRMADRIAAGQVSLWRDYSQNVADKFTDGQFDWIFVDGLHTYEGVKSDLALYSSKVKENGLLLGHDYADHPEAKRMGFGVIQAVNEFVIEQGWSFLVLTNEPFPTYVLARSDKLPVAQNLLATLILQVQGLVMVNNYPHTRRITQITAQVGQQVRILPSI